MIIETFAGPGGWSEGLRMLGHSAVGIEWDEAACATARTAGHERIQADVAALDPVEFIEDYVWTSCERCGGWGRLDPMGGPAHHIAETSTYACPNCAVDGLIASPPCPSFSMAGKGAGRRDVDHVIACARDLAKGVESRERYREACEDERSLLSVEPIRWVLALRPTWVALEQVPPVLEIWKVFAALLEQHGYACWTGVLEAERYGVPQTRERAILMARRDGKPCLPPVATHQRYVKREARRHDVLLEGEVLPWVSMAEAIGWGMTERPSVTVTSGSGRTGGPSPLDGGSGARAAIRSEREAGRWGAKPLASGSGSARLVRDEVARGAIISPERIAPRGSMAVSVGEAGVLQSFRSDYPWQGTVVQQHQQVGNAIPPLLARAILAELL